MLVLNVDYFFNLNVEFFGPHYYVLFNTHFLVLAVYERKNKKKG